MTDQEMDGLRGCSPETEGDLPLFQGHRQDQRNQTDEMTNNLQMFKKKMKDGKRAIVRLKRQQEDAMLDTIISDLVLVESHLRKEQWQILSQLANRDATIAVQRQEIERLRRDNRRLIGRLKKITEGRDNKEERFGDHISGGGPQREPGMKNASAKKSSKAYSTKRPTFASDSQCAPLSTTRPVVKHSVMTPLASQFYEKSALRFTDENGKIIDRVLHKPPIAEKPKMGPSGAPRRPFAAIIRNPNGQCSIVSTISRLLDEESDQGITGSSGSSEPSSPESTLKPTTPRVIRLARQYEKGLVSAHGSSASDSGRSSDDQYIKAVIMDEHEVTSGYNSDAVSDQEHEYENIVFFKGNSVPGTNEATEERGQDVGREEENYVILRSINDDHDNNFLIEDLEEQHIYSNIEYGPKEEQTANNPESRSLRDIEDLIQHQQLVETNLDAAESEIPESPKRAKNIPRSRHNINLVMTSEESRLMDNFEEFTLDSLDLEDLNEDDVKSKENYPQLQLRHSGDGAEAKSSSSKEKREEKGPVANQGGYEKFLEATGLSQKSILTPSRMFSNHRSMLKPRDVKHRDKLRAAFTSLSTLEEGTTMSTALTNHTATSQVQNSSQRYWREPYL